MFSAPSNQALRPSGGSQDSPARFRQALVWQGLAKLSVTHFTAWTTCGSQRASKASLILVAPGEHPARWRAFMPRLAPQYSGVCMSLLKLAKVPAFLAAAALTAVVPGRAQAQSGVSLVPWAGAY